MENLSSASEKFTNPQEEISYLREMIAKKEKEILERTPGTSVEHVAHEEVARYAEKKPAEVLHEKYIVPTPEMEAVVLDLSPEAHDQKMNELLGMLETKGIHATLSIIDKMNDPHVYDDFHRLLVQYLRSGFVVGGLKEKDPLWKSLNMSLFEILVPENEKKDGPQKPLKELLSSMEQFYSGMLSNGNSDEEPFAFEIAVANHSDDFVFYASVSNDKRNLFEKQILSIFPDAKVTEHKDDFNIFNEKGATAASYAVQKKNHIYPIKTYEQFDHDPINALLNCFSGIDKDGEGAAIQIVFNPVGDFYVKKYQGALEKVRKGEKLSEAIDIAYSFGHKAVKSVASGMLGFLNNVTSSKEEKEKKKEEKKAQKGPRPEDELGMKEIEAKIATQVIETNIRIVASAESEAKAVSILGDIEASFNQFGSTQGNRLEFTRVAKGKLEKELDNFTYRAYDDSQNCPLSIRELATIMHLPVAGRVSTSQVKMTKSGTSAAPLDLPQMGTYLGTNTDRGRETKVYTTDEDRLRHLYVIGQTGTGKTTLLKNMIVQDMQKGNGLCFIDPHGSDVEDILALVPPNRFEDVIYFDPAYTARPMALNMLEYDARFPEQKTFVVNEMLSIFNKLFDMKTAGGPMFEQYFRNAVLLTIDDPSSNNTLVDVSRVLSNKAFRESKLATCKNPLVIQFWREVADKAGGEASLANIVPYIVSKFDNFLANDIMRPVISQEKSTFNFRDIMDNKKILLVNLSKGRLGDINANLIGLILIGKILMAALSRVDSLGKDLPPFYLYVDEFQNITTDSIATILSEARKYKLSLNIAHQFIKQLDEKIKNAVFGNVGSMAVFRVGTEDAEFLAKQFEPVFTQKDIINIDNYNAYVKLLAGGRPVKPFNISTPNIPKGDAVIAGKLKELSYLTYGKDRAEIEAQINEKYKK
ncbi:MAG: TraM recognition domain-containing protein [Candidatus Pacebacteria bacterium]|nr:TraM recognition domain-containing protein [Candidatus Paceibacterota bacterium]